MGAPGVVETVDQFGNVGFVETMGAPQVAYASAPLAYGAAPVSYGAAPMSYGTSSYGTRMAGAQQSFTYGNYAQAPVSYGTTYAGGYAQPYTGGSVFGSQPFSFSAANAATVTAAVPKVVTTQKAKRGCC